MRRDADLELVRFVDDGGILIRRDLLDLAVAVVDPDLDDVDLELRVILDGLAAFLRAVDEDRRAQRLGPGDAAARAHEARGAGYHLVAYRQQFEIISAHAHGGAHAPIGALLEVA